MTASTWTEDRIGRLKSLWLAGRSADKIARELAGGVTRSAVLGKVYRLGLSAGRAARPVATPGPRAVPEARLSRRSFVSSPLAPQPATPERGLATVLSVRRCECRWPFGDPRRNDFSLCGRPITRGAFCASHAAIAYQPWGDTRRTLERLARLD